MTDGVVSNVIPFFVIALTTTQLAIPVIALPDFATALSDLGEIFADLARQRDSFGGIGLS